MLIYGNLETKYKNLGKDAETIWWFPFHGQVNVREEDLETEAEPAKQGAKAEQRARAGAGGAESQGGAENQGRAEDHQGGAGETEEH